MKQESPDGRGGEDDDGAADSPGSSIVDSILDGERRTVFENKQLVDSNTIVDHNRIYGRDEQLAAEARAFRDTLDGERPPDLLLYGPSGTGKSLTVKAVAEKVSERATQNDIAFDFVAVNFKTMESHSLDRAVWKLGHQTANKAGVEWGIPRKGVSTDAKYVRLYEIVDRHFDALVFILDEIDALTGRVGEDEPAYSRLLYSLSRVMAEQHVDTLVSTVVITNHPKFRENLDSRTDSSYNPTGIHFSDYDANELIEILNRRRDAFKEGALDDGVIELVAAYGAKNEGDARRAIDLLRDAGEIANRNGETVVTEQHVHAANDSVVKNRVLEMVGGMTLQKKLSLYAAAVVADVNDGAAPSPAVYALYREICQRTDRDVYTQETVNSHINKAGTYGVLESERTSGGFKSGVHLMFTFTEPVEAVLETLEEDETFDELDASTARTIARQSLRDS
ncbi:cell division control protein Cdc6 [Halobiforma lacisalsi AJ5]|uniref:ORC1-type DNA replication protein n=1 Tax=Natronobacterium lacisalsi AJ5 TaxID=358396 RepID=M0L7J1_NATLA|nr:AAA family ATPase [Halobiforma lacisalsi]APW98324.1 cell division control protein Cdc6 [Halobiforma lacisalsi AJ5]EMA27925.1 orc1/cdc6 family replication initiation protein [Halobiforma lacisalsi AJ5]